MRPHVKKNWWYIKNYISTHSCVDCNEKDPRVLEFDHREDKIMTISQAMWKMTFEELRKEIGKCDIRCANDHKRKHYLDSSGVNK